MFRVVRGFKPLLAAGSILLAFPWLTRSGLVRRRV